MRVLRIEQPYASMICAGIQTEIFVETPLEYCGKVLIYSAHQTYEEQEVERTMPRRQYNLLANAIMFEALPESERDFLTDHILGVVEVLKVSRAEDRRESIWYKAGTKFCLEVSDAKEFDVPVACEVADGPFFEFPDMQEMMLPPCHAPFRLNGWRDGEFYFIRVKDERLEGMLQDILAPVPFDWHNIDFAPQPELGLSIADKAYVEWHLQYLCLTSDKRIIVLRTSLIDGDYETLDDSVCHDGDSDYFYFSIYWSLDLMPKIITLEEFQHNRQHRMYE